LIFFNKICLSLPRYLKNILQEMDNSQNLLSFFGDNLQYLWSYTGIANCEWGNIIMTIVGCVFIYLAAAKRFEPMLLIPIGFGILVGNIPFPLEAGLRIGIYEEGSVLNILYGGVKQGWYPPLIFLGIGAMTDFSALIANPKLVLVGAAAQFGIFGAYMLSLALGFDPREAGAIGIIGGADGPTAIFLSSKLAPHLMGAIAVAAYSYMALIPVFQPPIMKALTTKKERLIRMKAPGAVSHKQKLIFPIVGLLLTCYIIPSGLPLLGMLFFGNILKECGVPLRDRSRTAHRHRHHPLGLHRRLLDAGFDLLDTGLTEGVRSGRPLVPGSHGFRRPLRQVLQPLLEGGQQDQPAHR
jgi:oxaloacetate decarboxylase beta subunit